MYLNCCLIGDCHDTLLDMRGAGVKVQTCITSPPYYGLRDYGHPGQIGREASPQEYIDTLVGVFRLVREVLADDGLLFLNLGDSYTRDPKKGGSGPNGKRVGGGGLKAKDLMGIPWSVALALRDDGWYLRQDIVWNKPNPMPESVADRFTKAHEYLFMLSKSERYYFDQSAIMEPADKPAGPRQKTNKYQSAYEASTEESLRTKKGLTSIGAREWRNKRSVWTIATTPYHGAHFAVMPAALVEPCVLAGSRPGDTVLDPFFGSGTVGYVAQKLGRNWLGCEINEQYIKLQKDRTLQASLGI